MLIFINSTTLFEAYNGDFDQIHDNVESILKWYVNQHIVNAIDKKCNIPSLKIAESKDQGSIIHVEGAIFDTKNGKIKARQYRLEIKCKRAVFHLS